MAMALAVSLQLLLSLVMVPPDEEHASTTARFAFEAHQWVGLAAVVVVILHWLWSAISLEEGSLADLFPWSGPGRAAIKEDLAKVRNRELPEGGPRGGLPGLVHGLGFLAVTGMALTGLTLFIIFPESGKPDSTVESVADIHSLIANFVWVYWFGHVAMALGHRWAGHPNVKDMFSLKS
jgi:cytochrome b561